jgi:hypothetical protein
MQDNLFPVLEESIFLPELLFHYFPNSHNILNRNKHYQPQHFVAKISLTRKNSHHKILTVKRRGSVNFGMKANKGGMK